MSSHRVSALRAMYNEPTSAEQDDAFNAWYDVDHWPEVLRAFPSLVLAAHRYRVSDIDLGDVPYYAAPERLYLHLYELLGTDAELEEYGPDVSRRWAAGEFTTTDTLSTAKPQYSELYHARDQGSAFAGASPAVLTLHVDATDAAHDSSLIEFFEGVHAPAVLQEFPVVESVRLFVAAPPPTDPSMEPFRRTPPRRYLALYELGSRAPEQLAAFAGDLLAKLKDGDSAGDAIARDATAPIASLYEYVSATKERP